MADIKKAIRDLAVIAVGILVVDVIFTATGMALASLNSATANLSPYVSVSTLAGVISTITPILGFAHVFGGIVVLLELFGADSLLQVG